MILKFVQRWFNKRTRDIMQGANADDCIPSWRILLCLVHSWRVRIAADPHANSPSQTEGRRPCLAPNPHDALCRFCSPSRTQAPNPHCCVERGDTSSNITHTKSYLLNLLILIKKQFWKSKKSASLEWCSWVNGQIRDVCHQYRRQWTTVYITANYRC